MNFPNKILSIEDLNINFPDEESCIFYLEKLRWPGKVISPFDVNSTVYRCTNYKFKCKNTNKYFTVKSGTIFDSTKIFLFRWFLAIYLYVLSNRTISSLQLAKELHITQRTCSFIIRRLKLCFDDKMFKKLVDFDRVLLKVLEYRIVPE